jgi:N-acetyl-gamma-glutamyl-phosphate reductase
MSKSTRAVIAGVTGYAGRELMNMLARHSQIELVGAFASRGGETQPLAVIHPQLTGQTQLNCEPFDEAAVARLKPDVIFLATPNEFSMEVVPALLETGATVIDISGAYRLQDVSNYPRFYGFEHQHPELVKQAVYGLTEFASLQLKGAKLIANPGCYVTSILVPLTPIMHLLDLSQPIICDAKSGVTGAGKSPTATTHFVEVSESLKTYKLLYHQHTPEIAQGLGISNTLDKLIFTPHMLPINRGILSTIYVRLITGATRQDVYEAWAKAFGDAPCVRVFAGSQMPEIKFAAHTPFCDIGCVVDEASNQAVILSAEDNLLKGAASQALQNANVALGFDEKDGIL